MVTLATLVVVASDPLAVVAIKQVVLQAMWPLHRQTAENLEATGMNENTNAAKAGGRIAPSSPPAAGKSNRKIGGIWRELPGAKGGERCIEAFAEEVVGWNWLVGCRKRHHWR